MYLMSKKPVETVSWAVWFGLMHEKLNCNSDFPGFLRIFLFVLFSNMLGRHILMNQQNRTVLLAF